MVNFALELGMAFMLFIVLLASLMERFTFSRVRQCFRALLAAQIVQLAADAVRTTALSEGWALPRTPS